MKSNFIILSLFISTIGLAQAVPPATPTAPQSPAEPVPEKTEIKVCKTYDGSAYKVVRKDEECGPVKEANEPAKEKPTPKPVPKPKPKPKPVPTTTKKCPPCKPQIQIVEKEKEKIVDRVTYKKWRIYGLVGIGQDGMSSIPKIEGEQVDKYYGFVGGAGIDYHMNESWSIGVQGLSNESGMFSLGYSFGD